MSDDELLFLTEEENRLSTLLLKLQEISTDLDNRLFAAESLVKKSSGYVRTLEENYRILRYDIPVVSLRRYRETVDALIEHRELVVVYSKEIQDLRAKISKNDRAVQKAQADFEKIIESRSEFGVVYEFGAAGDD